MRLNAEAEFGEDAGHDLGHAKRDDDTQASADHGGEDIVGHSLRHEHLDQLPALGPDRASHAHLRLPLGGEHDEDHDDEQHAGGDGEEPEDEEEGGEDVARCFGILNEVLLDVFDFQSDVV